MTPRERSASAADAFVPVDEIHDRVEGLDKSGKAADPSRWRFVRSSRRAVSARRILTMTSLRQIVLAIVVALGALLVTTGCGNSSSDKSTVSQGGDSGASASAAGDQNFPDVVEVKAEQTGDGLFSFDVTMTSPYDTAKHYADGWRIRNADGTVYGEKTLDHDHASEQPFTRTQTDVKIPAGVTSVVVEGRDIDGGYGGATVTVELPTS